MKHQNKFQTKKNVRAQNVQKNSSSIIPVETGFIDGTQMDVDGKIVNQVNMGSQVRASIKETIQQGSKTLGDVVEKFGKRLRKNGYYKVASRFEKMGNTIEHIAD